MRHLLAFALVAACGSKPPASTPSNAAPSRPAPAPTARDRGDPYQAKTWIARLGDPAESERAVAELEQLGDPSAIPALADAWAAQGKPVRILHVIVGLARPLTPAQAKAQFLVDYEVTGRPASWDSALPVLVRALAEVDEANPRLIECATKAADALGEAKLPGGLDALAAIATRPTTKRLIGAQVAAIRALGRFADEKARATAALVQLIERDPPPHPRTAMDKGQARALEETYSMFLGTTGAAINAIGALRTPDAVVPLVLAPYRTPELFIQIRRALVASGPTAEAELRTILRGEHAAANQLIQAKHLDRDCGDRDDAPPAQCRPVSARDFYAAVVLGDFYDPAAVGDLLAALKRPALPVYYLDDQPSPNTQHNAVFDALRKIDAPEAEAPVRALWMRKGDLATRVLAIGAYPFVSRNTAGIAELGKIAADNAADDVLSQEAATAFARLSRDPKDIAILQGLAQRYFDDSAKRAKAAAPLRKDADAADAALATARKALDDARAQVLAITRDATKTAQEIRVVTEATRRVEDDFKVLKQRHRDQVATFKRLDSAAKAYLGYARMFQIHIARIEIALRCKTDLDCYAASLALTPDVVTVHVAKYIPDIASWTPDDKRELVAAAIERAMLELGKQGAKASPLTGKLLDAAASDHRLIRQSVLLALPKIAPLPCAPCEARLDAVIAVGAGKITLGDLELETTILRNYFTWAGRKPAAN